MATCVRCKEETSLYDNGVPFCLKCANLRDPKDQDVNAILVKALHSATTRAETASVEFNAVMGNRTLVPGGPELIAKASRELSSARKAMLDAHERLNNLLARGIVPDELTRSGSV